MGRELRYEYMFPQDFRKEIERMPVFFVPTGLLEWHGDHLPLGQDTLKAYGICLRAAEKLDGGIVLPPNYYGRPGFSRYVGTLTYSEECMGLLFAELFGQLEKVGARIIVLLTGHYGDCQVGFVKKAAREYMESNPSVHIIAQPEYEGITLNGEMPADHAGKWETSMFWYLYPDRVRMDNFSKETSLKMIYADPPHDYYKEEEDWEWKEDLSEVSSPELGKQVIELITDKLKDRILELLKEL